MAARTEEQQQLELRKHRQYRSASSPKSPKERQLEKSPEKPEQSKLFHEMSPLIHTNILDMIGDQPDGIDRMFMNSDFHSLIEMN